MKVLIVDDSVVFRMALREALSTNSEIEITGVVNNGKKALEFLEDHDVDLVILDLEMPVMDGITTLKEIRKNFQSLYVVVYSAFSQTGAMKTLEALQNGADDFVTKAEGTGNVKESIENAAEVLLPKILQFSSKRTCSLSDKKPKKSASDKIDEVLIRPEIICIASSTGGPDALRKIFREVNRPILVPIVIVQHMPPMFTKQLASMLDKLCPHVSIKEAENGETLEKGHCYIAPGDFHMELVNMGERINISLNQKDKVCQVRPAADPLFQSVARIFDKKVMAVILTGMGEDPLQGCMALRDKGKIFIQDEATSVVWGMPGSIASSDLPYTEVGLDSMHKVLMKAS